MAYEAKAGLGDLKLTGGERRSAYAMPSAGESEQYSYGLCIRLENAELDKLGVKRLPTPGDEYDIAACAKVKSVHEDQVEPGKANRAITLQITHMKIK